MSQEEKEALQEKVEKLIGEYCDRTLSSDYKGGLVFSLETAYFVDTASPQELANRLMLLFNGENAF